MTSNSAVVLAVSSCPEENHVDVLVKGVLVSLNIRHSHNPVCKLCMPLHAEEFHQAWH